MSLVNMRRRGRVLAGVEVLGPIMQKLVIVERGGTHRQLAELRKMIGCDIALVRVWTALRARWSKTESYRVVVRQASPEDVVWFALTEDGAKEVTP